MRNDLEPDEFIDGVFICSIINCGMYRFCEYSKPHIHVRWKGKVMGAKKDKYFYHVCSSDCNKIEGSDANVDCNNL
jgi:hypothetical protein